MGARSPARASVRNPPRSGKTLCSPASASAVNVFNEWMEATDMNDLWLTTVDERGGTLWHGRVDGQARLRLEAVSTIESGWEEHEHGRPSPLQAKNGHTHASWHHEDEERVRRFSHEVLVWLDEHVQRRDIDELHLFAPPRLRGSLRHSASGHLPEHLVEHEQDLCPFAPGDLATHPAVTALVATRTRQ